jgi:hypothetical protein
MGLTREKERLVRYQPAPKGDGPSITPVGTPGGYLTSDPQRRNSPEPIRQKERKDESALDQSESASVAFQIGCNRRLYFGPRAAEIPLPEFSKAAATLLFMVTNQHGHHDLAVLDHWPVGTSTQERRSRSVRAVKLELACATANLAHLKGRVHDSTTGCMQSRHSPSSNSAAESDRSCTGHIAGPPPRK